MANTMDEKENQLMPSQHEAGDIEVEDLDLSRIFRALLQQKKLILAIVIVAGALFWGILLANSFREPAAIEYSRQFKLAFSGIEKGQYPNESAFSVRDMLVPAVLSEIYEHNSLNQWMTYDEFTTALNVDSFAPNYVTLKKAFEAEASQKKISSAELKEINSKFLLALQNAAKSHVVVKMTVPDSLGIPPPVAEKILLEVPETWATWAVTKMGVLQLDVKVYSESIIDEKFISGRDYPIVYDILVEKVKDILQNIKNLENLANASRIKDPKSGLSLTELSVLVNDLQSYEIEPLFDPVTYFTISKDKERLLVYYNRRLRDLNRERVLKENLIANIEKSLLSYLNAFGGARPIPISDQEGSPRQPSMVIPQVGETFLREFLFLAEKSSDMTYRQDMTDKIIALGEEKEVLAVQEKRVEEVMKYLTSTEERSLPDSSVKKFIADLDSQTPRILARMKEFLSVTVRIHDQLSKEALNPAGALYSEAGSQTTTTVSGALISAYNLKMFALVIVLSLMAGVGTAFMRNTLKSRT